MVHVVMQRGTYGLQTHLSICGRGKTFILILHSHIAHGSDCWAVLWAICGRDMYMDLNRDDLHRFQWRTKWTDGRLYI